VGASQQEPLAFSARVARELRPAVEGRQGGLPSPGRDWTGDEWAEARDAQGNRRLDDTEDFVRIEIESALARNIPVIPLLVRGAQLPAEEHLPPSLRQLVYQNGMPIRPDPDFHHDIDRLISALNQYL